jgi:hypothetical protein
MAGCKGHLGREDLINVSLYRGLKGTFLIFFCQNCHSAKFLEHSSKNAAPLHPFNLNSFNINKLIVVQRRVHQGAMWCKGGALEQPFRPLHPDLKWPQFLLNPQKVQGCKGINALKQFHGIVVCLIKWRKNTLFIYIFLVLSLWLERCYYRGLCYSVMGLCQPVLVTWLTGQTKGRNERTLFTAHNYKLCSMAIVRLHSIKGLRWLVCQNSAVRNQLPQFRGRDRAVGYPPPHEKLTTQPPARPPYGLINYSDFSNLFLFLVLYLQLLFVGARGGIA